MKTGEIVRFEIEYRLRQASTWLYAGILFGVPFLMMHAVDGGTAAVNAPETVASISVVMGMLGMLVTAALFGDAATRDVQTGMHPLFYTAPIRPPEYLGGRFLGALAVNAVLVAGIPLGFLAASFMPYMDPRMFGPFQAGAYVQPYLLFLLPNLVLAAAILFAVAALTRQTLPAYLSGIGLFVGYLLALRLHELIGNPNLAALLDPFGATALETLTQYWTPVERNARLVGFAPLLLWNRLLWLAVAAVVLGLLLVRFRFVQPGTRGRRRWRRVPPAAAEPVRTRPVVVPAVPRDFGPAARARQTLVVAGHALREILASRAFFVIVAAALLIVFWYGWDVGAIVFGTSTWPVTHLVAGTVLTLPFSMIMPVVIALFAGELVWRERDARVSEIAHAAPVPDWVPLLGRFLALVGMIVVLQAVLMAGGILLQTLKGYHHYELGLYLRILFGMTLVDYVLFAVLAMAVHVVVDHKYGGHLVVVLAYLFTAFSGDLGIRHNLLIYGGDPGWVYSDFSGFGPFAAPFAWFKLYWAAWALLLAVLARLFWVRGRERGLRGRMARARTRLSGTAARAAAVGAALVLALGGFIFYNTNVLNEYRTPFQSAELRAEYERRYGRYEHLPQPAIAAADLRVEIHPGEGAAELRGSYRLVNRTAAAIDSIHLLVHPDVRARSLAWDRPARQVLDDRELQYGIYALETPLQPGDTLRLAFDLEFRARGFANAGSPTEVVDNGTFFDRRWLPFVGYQPSLGLTGARERGEHGLPSRPLADPHGPEAQRLRLEPRNAVHVDAVVGTAGEQIAITTGRLVREWRENGRRYFHYRTDAPLPFHAPFLSAEYDVREDRWNGVALRILHHPAHTVNLDRMVRGMKASLEYYTDQFGPYPFHELRIVEFPRYASFARAYPHTIAFSEGSAFLTRVEEGDVDRPFFVVAHEVAHQWWGGQVAGANVQGAAFLSESLAQYSAMMVMEKALGPEQVRRFYDFEMDRYLRGRRVFANKEVPLLRVEDQSYLYYHKGAVALYTLREHIGEARVNTALRRFLETNRERVPPYPTSLNLYAELRAVTPDSLRYLVHDLLAEITLWNVRTAEARVEPTGTGAFRVTLEVEAKKARADSIGNETEVPMDDLVEIGVFAAGEGGGEPLYLRRHRVRSGRQTITVVVPREPARAGIDPYRKLIQREPEDNVVRVEAAAPAAVPR